MPLPVTRRDFLVHSIAGLGLAATGTSCMFGRSSGHMPPSDQLFGISLAQWSLHQRLLGRASPKLDNLDPAAAARRLGIDAIEYVNSFFKEQVHDRAYLREMRDRADGEGVASLLIMCDGEGNLGDADEARRAQAIENHRKWIEAAAFLRCHSIRVNARSSGSYDEQMDRAADGLRRLTELAAAHDINVLVENHGGLSSDGAWLAGVMTKVGDPRCGTLPDFGNFALGGGKTYDRYKGVKELMPFARAVSAKSYDFDDEGNETTIDYYRMMRIVVDAGYRGYVGIEFEGKRFDEEDGILATKALLERVRGELAD